MNHYSANVVRLSLYERSGSVGEGPDGHTVDLYKLVCSKTKCKISLYFDLYHGSASKLLPQGLHRGDKQQGMSVEDYLRGHPEQAGAIEKLFG